MLELLLTMAEEFCWRREVSSGYSTYDKSLLLLKTFKDDFDLEHSQSNEFHREL